LVDPPVIVGKTDYDSIHNYFFGAA
jgi:hypothetical protein